MSEAVLVRREEEMEGDIVEFAEKKRCQQGSVEHGDRQEDR